MVMVNNKQVNISLKKKNINYILQKMNMYATYAGIFLRTLFGFIFKKLFFKKLEISLVKVNTKKCFSIFKKYLCRKTN